MNAGSLSIRRRGRGAARRGVRARRLLSALGVLGAVAAHLPVFDLDPPAPATVDPRTAAVASLLTLPGIGPARARAVVEARAAGPEALRELLAARWARRLRSDPGSRRSGER